jgi:AraC-like DNA-binding protein
MLPDQTFRRLARAKELIHDCFAEPLTLEDIATEADFSPWHFLRLFRQTFSRTPHEFLTELRLRKAKELLSLTSRSVTEICFDVGFESLGSFSTLFRKWTGQSPIQYRRTVRELITVPGLMPAARVPSCMLFRFGGQRKRS